MGMDSIDQFHMVSEVLGFIRTIQRSIDFILIS